MAPRSKITKMPEAVKLWLEEQIVSNSFGGYELIEADLNAMLKAAGATFTISKSSIHRHGQLLERRMAAVRASTEAARQIAASSPDDADERSAAVLSMIQSDTFNILLQMQDVESANPEERLKLMSVAARSAADLARASVMNKRFQTEVKARIQSTADAVEAIAKKGGLSAEALDTIRRNILGIAA